MLRIAACVWFAAFSTAALWATVCSRSPSRCSRLFWACGTAPAMYCVMPLGTGFAAPLPDPRYDLSHDSMRDTESRCFGLMVTYTVDAARDDDPRVFAKVADFLDTLGVLDTLDTLDMQGSRVIRMKSAHKKVLPYFLSHRYATPTMDATQTTSCVLCCVLCILVTCILGSPKKPPMIVSLPASPNRYPYICQIISIGDSHNILTYCTGILISPKMVLTSAHGISTRNPQNIAVFIGQGANMKLSWTVDLKQELPVASIVFPASHLDCAVITLSRPSSVQPVKVAGLTAPVPSVGSGITSLGYSIDGSSREFVSTLLLESYLHITKVHPNTLTCVNGQLDPDTCVTAIEGVILANSDQPAYDVVVGIVSRNVGPTGCVSEILCTRTDAIPKFKLL